MRKSQRSRCSQRILLRGVEVNLPRQCRPLREQGQKVKNGGWFCSFFRFVAHVHETCSVRSPFNGNQRTSSWLEIPTSNRFCATVSEWSGGTITVGANLLWSKGTVLYSWTNWTNKIFQANVWHSPVPSLHQWLSSFISNHIFYRQLSQK